MKKSLNEKSEGEKPSKPGDRRHPPKTLYERLVGKSLVTPEVKKASVKTALINWFAKETAEERAFRNILKGYRNQLTNELQQIAKALQRHQRRFQDQRHEFDKQEKQLIAWGLKGAIQKFHMQAWFRLERCRLQEKITSEIDKIVTQRQSRSIQYLQHFEETDNRKDKFSTKEAEEFCQSPESLIMLDSVVLTLHERLKKLDLLCTYATRQFLLLEPDFAWKDAKKRSKILYAILTNYNMLPQVNALENIENDLTWEQFCMWCAVRAHKLRQIEQEYSDFIEDQRELEGRLFFRWHSSVMLSIKTPDQILPRESIEGDPEHLKSRPTALRVTPASIKAFVRYFATEIIGVKYEVPKECLNASIALTESLFFRRLSPYIFRYIDRLQREKDEYWRIHSQKCRYISPSLYSVPEKYFVEKSKRREENKVENDDETSNKTNKAEGEHAFVPLHPFISHNPTEYYRATSVQEQERMRNSVDFPSLQAFQERKKGKESGVGSHSSVNLASTMTSSLSSQTPSGSFSQPQLNHTPFQPLSSSFILSPPSRNSENVPGSPAPPLPPSLSPPPTDRNTLDSCEGVSPARLFTPEVREERGGKEKTNEDEEIERLSLDELQFPIEVHDSEQKPLPVGLKPEQGTASPERKHKQHKADRLKSSRRKEEGRETPEKNGQLGKEPISSSFTAGESFCAQSDSTTSHLLEVLNADTILKTSSSSDIKVDSVSTSEIKSPTLIAAIPVSISQEGAPLRESNSHNPLKNGTNTANNTSKATSSRQNSPALPAETSKANRNSNSHQQQQGRRHIHYCTCQYCQTFSLSLRLQRFPKYEVGMEDGLPYARASRVLSWMNLAVYPREMIFYLSLACKWILRDAIDISGSRSIIGADTMVPLFTMVLIHARIPNIHLLLYILMQYGEYDEQGDISYNIANLEGSMQFIMQMEIPQEIMDRFQQTSLYESIITSINGNIFHRKMSLVGGKEGASMVMDPTGNHLLTAYSPSSFNESALKASFASANSISTASQEELRALDLKAMQELGEWLRDQQTMEETIAILQNDGWML